MPAKPNHKFKRAMIDVILRASDKAVERGIVRLNQLQTEDERQAHATKYDNMRGFQSCYANQGTYMANWVLSGRKLDGRFLEKARKICLKHSRQLTAIANGELEVPDVNIPHH